MKHNSGIYRLVLKTAKLISGAKIHYLKVQPFHIVWTSKRYLKGQKILWCPSIYSTHAKTWSHSAPLNVRTAGTSKQILQWV